MALSIKNRKVEELARELERARIVAQARPGEDDFVSRVMAIARRCAALPVLDNRSADEILGYGEDGLPH